MENIPFGQLSRKEQEALKAWPHGVEIWSGAVWWTPKCEPVWGYGTVYRAKQSPNSNQTSLNKDQTT